MHEFLLRIKAISNALASIGSPVSLQEHIDAILEGLPQDYHSVISVIESKFQSIPIEEVEALLLFASSQGSIAFDQPYLGEP